MNYDEFLYQMHYSQYMAARRYIKQAEKDTRYSRISAVIWGCFGLFYAVLLFAVDAWWYIIFVIVFLSLAGLHVWMGWWFYPDHKRSWERALADHQKQLESLAPNVKENPEVA